MSTRSIIGTTDGTTFEGIYCHFDGYPTNMGLALAKIITRDGADALPVLLGEESRARAGKAGTWDSLVPEMPAPDTALPYEDRSAYIDAVPDDEQDPGVHALYTHLGMGSDESTARDHVIEGYGVISTHGTIRFSGTVKATDTGWCEWAYLFDENLTLRVYDCQSSLILREVAQFTVADMAKIASGDDEAVKRLGHAECGENYERCTHVAWAHDRDAPEESQRLGMLQWLGRRPIPAHDAIAAIVGGTRYDVTGSYQVRNRVLSLRLQGGDDLPVARTDQRGNVVLILPDVELVFPPTKPELAKAGA